MAPSGNMTGIIANAPVFSLRNTGTNIMLIHRLNMAINVTTGFTTQQVLGYAAYRASNFTTSDSGGVTSFVAGANKHRVSMPSWSSAPDIRAAGANALTSGTRALDTNPIGITLFTGIGGSINAYPNQPLFSSDPGDYPFVLRQNEGIVVSNLYAMGAAGVVTASFNLEYSEHSSY